MRAIIYITLVALLAACDHFPRHQYVMGSNETDFANQVCKDLLTLSNKNDLITREPVREETLCYFSDSELNGVVLGARKLDGQIVVDIQGFNSRKKVSLIRKATEEMISLKYPNVQINSQ